MPLGLSLRPLTTLFSTASTRVRSTPFIFRGYGEDSREEDTVVTRGRMPKTAYYAVSVGRAPGIYRTWAEAEAQVKGFVGARHKKFPTEAAAQSFMGTRSGEPYVKPIAASSSTETASSSKTRQDSPPTFAKTSLLPPALAALAAKGYSFSRATPHRLVVYTDGSGLGNGMRGAVAGAGVFWGGTGEAAKNNLAERVPGPLQTNNRGELLSIIRAIETCPYPDMPLEIRTDSQYSIRCMTIFVHKWVENGWKPAAASKRKGGGPVETVKNADMIRHLLVLLRKRPPNAQIRFKYVRGHSGHEGNDAADKLARAGAMQPERPDRTDWLVPEEDVKERPSDIEVDPEWLLGASELADLESELADM